MEMIYKLSGRASKDLDYSIKDDFPEENLKSIEERVKKSLENTFSENGFFVFDIKLFKRPDRPVSEDLRNFWGGYRICFKVISVENYKKYNFDIEQMRKRSIELNEFHFKSFMIDISKYEYTENKVEKDFEGYSLYVYPPEMLVFEKVRAICQQMLEYGKIVRSKSQSPRARDFYDIYLLLNSFEIDIESKENLELLGLVFKTKNVPTGLINKIENHMEYHSQNFDAVVDTVSSKEDLKNFDFYFDFVVDKFGNLKIPRIE